MTDHTPAQNEDFLHLRQKLLFVGFSDKNNGDHMLVHSDQEPLTIIKVKKRLRTWNIPNTITLKTLNLLLMTDSQGNAMLRG